MSCPHPSLIQSTSYPVGTRCGQCGASAESILSECRGKLGAAEQQLREATARVSTLERFERVANETQLKFRNAEESARLFRSAAEDSAEKLSQQLGQIESLSKENIRLMARVKEVENSNLELEQKLEQVTAQPTVRGFVEKAATITALKK